MAQSVAAFHTERFGATKASRDGQPVHMGRKSAARDRRRLVLVGNKLPFASSAFMATIRRWPICSIGEATLRSPALRRERLRRAKG